MKIRTAIILILLTAIGGGVIYYYERQVQLLQDLSYQLISFSLGSQVTGSSLQLNMTVRISSQSTLDALVSSLYVDVYVNGQLMGSVTNSAPFPIPAMGYSDAPLSINVSPALIVGDLVNLVAGGLATQDYVINLVGYVKVKEAFLTISVPFNYSTTLKQILS